jgi:hypothetical protein
MMIQSMQGLNAFPRLPFASEHTNFPHVLIRHGIITTPVAHTYLFVSATSAIGAGSVWPDAHDALPNVPPVSSRQCNARKTSLRHTSHE